MTSALWQPPDQFWNSEFQAQTDGGRRPTVFKHLLPPDLVTVDDVLKTVLRLQQAHAASDVTAAKVRVYVGEDRRDDLVRNILTTAWGPKDDFLAWMQKVVGAKRFSLVINNLETLSEPLSASIGAFNASMFANWGLPVGGCEQVAFIGNYAGTAFGVHEGYEDAFQFHLGPGVKHFYCWSQDTYTRLTGSPEPIFGDYRWLLSHGECFDLETGDVLFLPRRVFHVGVQSHFSVAVTVPIYTYPYRRLLARAILPQLLEAVLQLSEETPSPLQQLAGGWPALVRDISPSIDDLLAVLTQHLGTLLPPIIADRWQALVSNGGWEVLEHDLARNDAAHIIAEAERLQPGASLALRPPYRLCWTSDESDGESAQIYLRGVSVPVTHLQALAPVLHRLNAGEAIIVPDAPAVVEGLRALYSTGGLQRDTSTTPERE